MYNKLFSKILDSSIWLEKDSTRIAWITILAAMDEDGFCPFASVGNLAQRAVISREAAESAVKVLESSSLIESVAGGWLVSTEFSKPRRSAISVIVKREVFDRDGGRCIQCGSTEHLEYDHRKPWIMGGSDEISNIQLLCRSCNRRKGPRRGWNRRGGAR